MRRSRPRYRVSGGVAAIPGSYDEEGPAFSRYKMDEGPRFNRIGYLCLFLYKLGMRSPVDIFLGNVKNPTWFLDSDVRP